MSWRERGLEEAQPTANWEQREGGRGELEGTRAGGGPADTQLGTEGEEEGEGVRGELEGERVLP